MAGQGISTLTAVTTLADGDLFEVTDVSDTAQSSDGSSRKVTTANVSAAMRLRQAEVIIIAVGDETTALTTGTAKVTFRMPYAFTLTDIRASVTTAPSSPSASASAPPTTSAGPRPAAKRI